MPTPTPPPPAEDWITDHGSGRRRLAPRRPRPPRRSLLSQLGPKSIGIAIAAVAALIIVIVVVTSRGGGTGKPATIKTDRAVSALTSLLDGVDTDAALTTCPFGPVTEIAGSVKGELDQTTGLVDEVSRIVVGGKRSTSAVVCAAATPDDRIHVGRALYVYATPVPKGAYADYLTKTLLAGAEARVEAPEKYSGGTIYAYCLPAAADVKAGCAADWVAGDSKLVLGMQADGAGVTAKQITAALRRELTTLAARLGGDATTTTSTTSTTSAAESSAPASAPATAAPAASAATSSAP